MFSVHVAWYETVKLCCTTFKSLPEGGECVVETRKALDAVKGVRRPKYIGRREGI